MNIFLLANPLQPFLCVSLEHQNRLLIAAFVLLLNTFILFLLHVPWFDLQGLFQTLEDELLIVSSLVLANFLVYCCSLLFCIGVPPLSHLFFEPVELLAVHVALYSAIH